LFFLAIECAGILSEGRTSAQMGTGAQSSGRGKLPYCIHQVHSCAMKRFLELGVVLVLSALFAIAGQAQKVDRVLILKKDHKLILLSGQMLIRTYSVAIGKGGLTPKQREGDHKTPEGLYSIDGRKQDSSFHRALHISYPNERDREYARELGVKPGGDIMIHGIANGLGWQGSLHRILDWTDGCVAVSDKEMMRFGPS
jgi:murein L,D-transpeptidase YafK